MSGAAAGRPGTCSSGRGVTPMSKPPRRRVSCCEPDRFQQRLQRQVLAERHEMDLVVERRQRSALAEHQEAVEDAPRPRRAGRRRLGAQCAGDEDGVRAAAARPMAARTSGWSSGRKGMAASGQITCVMPARLSISPAGLAADSVEVVEEDARLVLRAPLLPLRHARLHDADLDAGHGRLRRQRQADLAEQAPWRRAAPGRRPARRLARADRRRRPAPRSTARAAGRR